MKNQPYLERVTVPSILQRKASQFPTSKRITVVTAYDYTMARLVDEAGADIILVGDSLAAVMQGFENTLPVTLDEMIYHSRCVSRAAKRALVVGDLPFLSYQISPEKAVESAGRMLKEGAVSAVKLEGGIQAAETIERLTRFDIPVMGHVGLTPQSYHRMGGHKIQGRTQEAYAQILEDAKAVEEAGAFSLVIEGVPNDLAQEITASVAIPTIGIGAGAACDGQVLVLHDLLGLEDRFKPKFVKRYAELAGAVREAVGEFVSEVQSGTFPSEEYTFHAPSENKKKKTGSKLTLV